MELLLLFIAASIVAVVYIQVSASKQVTVATSATREEVVAVVRSCFLEKMNHIEVAGGKVIIKPKLKKDAATLTVDIADEGDNREATIWMSDWVSSYLRFKGVPVMPMGRAHALWVLRKRMKLQSRLGALNPASANP